MSNPLKPTWLSWCFQALLGLLVGALVGYFLCDPFPDEFSHGPQLLWQVPAAAWTVIIGSSTLSAGIFSYFGDALLAGRDHLGSNSPNQTPATRLASRVIGMIGFLTVAIGYIWYLKEV